jgi:hypothetical protein
MACGGEPPGHLLGGRGSGVRHRGQGHQARGRERGVQEEGEHGRGRRPLSQSAGGARAESKAEGEPKGAAAGAGGPRVLPARTGSSTTHVDPVPSGDEMVFVYRERGPHVVSMNSELGGRRPMYCTSVGKAYLAALPLWERGPLIRRPPLRAFTPHSITMRDDLEVEIRRTWQRGWSEDHVEFHPDSTCCGAVSGWKGVGRRLPRPAAGESALLLPARAATGGAASRCDRGPADRGLDAISHSSLLAIREEKI